MRVLWFHPRPLFPARGGGELRVSGEIGAVLDAGHQVLLVQPGSPGVEAEGFEVFELELRRGLGRALAKIVSRHPLRAPRVTRRSVQRAVRRISEYAPDVSIVSDQMSWSIARGLLPVEVPWVFDTHNLEGALFRDLASGARRLSARITFGIDASRVEAEERLMISACDSVVCVSSEDAAALRSLAPGIRPVVVPSSVRTPPIPATPAAARPNVLFVGTLDYPPNIAAVEELVREVMPVVRASVPDARLVVAGRRPTPVLRRLVREQSWVDFVEDAPDLGMLYHSARCVALPIRAGGGSRLKVYEALAYGLPTVGTSKAFSGVAFDPDSVVTCEGATEIAQALTRFLVDDDLADAFGKSARSCFLDVLAWEHAGQPLVDLIESLST